MNCEYCGSNHYSTSCPSCGASSTKIATTLLDIVSTGKGPDLVYRDMSPTTGITTLKISGGGPGDQQTGPILATDLCHWDIPSKESQS